MTPDRIITGVDPGDREAWLEWRLDGVGVTDREELIARVTPVVPIGHAVRFREKANARVRETHRRRHGSTRTLTRAEVPLSTAHRVGARAVLVVTLRSLVRNGTLTNEGGRYARSSRAARVSRQEASSP